MQLPTTTISRKVGRLFTTIKRKNPVHIKFGSKGFEPETEQGRTFLVTVKGSESDVQEVIEEPDDMALSIKGDKHCAITSKPLEIGGNRFYFTRDGFVGTMALNRDTLMDGDVYKPSKGKTELDVTDVNLDELDIPSEASTIEQDDGRKLLEFEDENADDWEGDIISLHGSKRTLYEMNKAKRLRKLLTPQGVDRDRMMAYIGSGVAIGFLIAQWIANN